MSPEQAGNSKEQVGGGQGADPGQHDGEFMDRNIAVGFPIEFPACELELARGRKT